jgi:hypothetical protein
MTYADAVQSWRDFYMTAGAAAATLVGLLFVGLSLHIRVVVSQADVKSLSRITLADFFVILLVALVILAPVGDAGATAAWLVAVAAVSAALVVRPAAEGFKRSRRRTIGLRVLLWRFGISTVCYLGVGTMGVLFGLGDVTGALSGLFLVVVLLLVVAVRNTWDLLVTVADRTDRSVGPRKQDRSDVIK